MHNLHNGKQEDQRKTKLKNKIYLLSYSDSDFRVVLDLSARKELLTNCLNFERRVNRIKDLQVAKLAVDLILQIVQSFWNGRSIC